MLPISRFWGNLEFVSFVKEPDVTIKTIGTNIVLIKEIAISGSDFSFFK